MNRLIFSKAAKLWAPLKQAGRNYPESLNQKFVRCNSTAASNNTRKTNDFVRYNHPTTPISSYNRRLNSAIKARDQPFKMLEKVLAVMNEMKASNIKPDLITYNSLLAAYSRNKQYQEVTDILQEMEEAGISPTVDTYNTILEAYSYTASVSEQILLKDTMKEKNIALNTYSYLHMLKGMCAKHQFEFALDTFEEMKQSKVAPNLSIYEVLISACVNTCEADAAFRLLKEAEKSDLAVESDPRVYMNVMRVGAFEDHADIIEYCWNKAVVGHSMRPDEGTCLNVLRVAAKSGNTSLCTDVIRQLSTSGFPYKEHYFTPLMEAFINKDDLKNAFNVLDIMRASGIIPTSRSALPIRQKLDKNVDAIDRAYYILEEMKKENKAVDITAFNTVLAACADAADIERTIATYREAQNLGVTPNVDTYNAVLKVCIRTRMKDMGNVVVDEMKKANISPNLDTYTNMIALACTQRDYEEAFTYLEEMKGYDIVPPHLCYATLAQKLAYEKDPRFYMVLEEMETYGYTIPYNLKHSFTGDNDNSEKSFRNRT